MELADSRERENNLQKKYQEQEILISRKTKEVKFHRSSNNFLLYFLILFIQDTTKSWQYVVWNRAIGSSSRSYIIRYCLWFSFLTHLFPMHLFATPENRKPYGFLMFSGARERVNWEGMGKCKANLS